MSQSCSRFASDLTAHTNRVRPEAEKWYVFGLNRFNFEQKIIFEFVCGFTIENEND